MRIIRKGRVTGRLRKWVWWGAQEILQLPPEPCIARVCVCRKVIILPKAYRGVLQTSCHEGLLYKLALFGFPQIHCTTGIDDSFQLCYGIPPPPAQSRRTTGSYSATSLVLCQWPALRLMLWCYNWRHLLWQPHVRGWSGNSSTDLQAMLEIVFSYSVQWCYRLNAQKSAIQIFAESAASHAGNRKSRQLLIGSEVIPDGVLRSVT